jgi:hypothetical protein
VIQEPAVTGLTDTLVGITPFPILGSEPAVNSSAKTPLRPKIPCENQEPPDLRSFLGGAPTQTRRPGAASTILQGPLANTKLGDLSRQYAKLTMDYMRAQQLASESRSRRSAELLADSTKALVEFNREDLPLYQKLVKQLGNGGGG